MICGTCGTAGWLITLYGLGTWALTCINGHAYVPIPDTDITIDIDGDLNRMEARIP